MLSVPLKQVAAPLKQVMLQVAPVKEQVLLCSQLEQVMLQAVHLKVCGAVSPCGAEGALSKPVTVKASVCSRQALSKPLPPALSKPVSPSAADGCAWLAAEHHAICHQQGLQLPRRDD